MYKIVIAGLDGHHQIMCSEGNDRSKNYKIFSQLCDLKCVTVYEINDIMKLYATSKIFQDFNLRVSNGVFEVFVIPYINVKRVRVINDKGVLPSVAKAIKLYFERERIFSSYEDIKRVCLELLMNNGVFSPRCDVRFVKSELTLYIGGYNQLVLDVVFTGLDQDEDPEMLEDLKSIKKDYVKRYFLPRFLEDIERETAVALSVYGYAEAKVNTEFESGVLKVNIKKGKKIVVFLYIEGYEEFGIDLRDFRDSMMESLAGKFSSASVIAYIEEALSGFNLSVANPKDIKIEEVDVQPSLKVVGINVKPSKASYLVRFKIHGLKYLDEDDFKKNLKIKTRSILNFFGLRQGIYEERKLDYLISDIPRIASQRGFEDFKIEKVEKKIEGRNMEIDVFVNEGERSVISDIVLVNFPPEVSDDIRKLLPRLPTFYDADKVISAKEKIQDYLKSQGFADFDIFDKQERETRRLKKIYFIYHGSKERGRICCVFINSETNHRFIKEISGIKEGALFTEHLINQGADILRRTQYFDSVKINYTAGYTIGNSERMYYVSIDSQEGKRNEVELSLGLSSVEGARGRAGFLSRNIFSYGVDLRSSFSVGYWIFPFARDYGITFLNFHLELSRRKLVGGFDSSAFFSPLYISTSFYSVGKPTYAGVSFSRLFRDLNISVLSTFEIRKLEVQKFEIKTEVGRLNQVYVISPAIYMSKPDFGVGLRGETIFSGILSQKVEIGGRFSLLSDFGGFGVFASAGRIFTKDIFYVPIERRFFLGGIVGPRGYQEMSIYPQRLYTGDILGEFRNRSQNYLSVMNELYLLKIGFARPYLFFDVGSVFQDGESPRFFKGVGPGIMFMAPFGEVRVDLGYGVDINIFTVHFAIGSKGIWF